MKKKLIILCIALIIANFVIGCKDELMLCSSCITLACQIKDCQKNQEENRLNDNAGIWHCKYMPDSKIECRLGDWSTEYKAEHKYPDYIFFPSHINGEIAVVKLGYPAWVYTEIYDGSGKWFIPYTMRSISDGDGIKMVSTLNVTEMNGQVFVPAKYEAYYKSKFPNANVKAANVVYHMNYENAPFEFYCVDNYDYSVQESLSKITIIPPEPQHEGYIFDGWYKEKECVNKWNYETDSLPILKTDINGQVIYQETSLYAKWTIDSEYSADKSRYIIRFFVDDSLVQEQFIAKKDLSRIVAPTVNKEVYEHFSGWYCDREYSKPFVDLSNNPDLEIGDNSNIINIYGKISNNHTFVDEWTIDETYHWHKSNCRHTEEVSIYKHTYDQNGVCFVCGYEKDSTANLYFSQYEDGSGYAVYGLNCDYENVVIPSTHNGLPVKTIGEKAFYGCENLKSIIIPESVTKIADNAFYDCESLMTVEIPNSVIEIGKNAFFGCYGLNAITIGESVKYIGENAFSDCLNLSQINFNANIERYNANNYFSNAGKNSDGITLKIGSNVTKIPQYEFCSEENSQATVNITSVIFEEESNCKSIEAFAFGYLPNLKKIEIPKSVTFIDSLAFVGCKSLENTIIDNENPIYSSEGNCIIDKGTKALIIGFTNSVIPSDGVVTTISANAFYDCGSLVNLSIPNGVTTIEKEAIKGCDNLASITIGKDVSSLNSKIFVDCRNLQNVFIDENNPIYKSNGKIVIEPSKKTLVLGLQLSAIPSDGSITIIGESAFKNVIGLTQLVIPDEVTEIGANAFLNCSELEILTLGSELTSIGQNAFGGCENLLQINFNAVALNDLRVEDKVFNQAGSKSLSLTVKIGASVMKIPDYMFYTSSTSESHLTEVIFEENCVCESVGEGAFYNSKKLANVTLPDGLKTLKRYAFDSCTALESIIIPDNVLSVAGFANCTSLKSVKIGRNVSLIASSAFKGCTALETVEFADGNQLTSIADNAFRECSSLEKIDIPNTVNSIEIYAFYGCKSLKNINIPTQMTKIGSNVFGACEELSEINYLGTVEQWLAIGKMENWDREAGEYVVVCANGTIDYNGAVFYD